MDTFVRHMSRVRETPHDYRRHGGMLRRAHLDGVYVGFCGSGKGERHGGSPAPGVLELALGETITDEELGGWQVHAETTGMADQVAENEEDCFAIIRRFLSYLPSHRDDAPPGRPGPTKSRGREWKTSLIFFRKTEPRHMT